MKTQYIILLFALFCIGHISAQDKIQTDGQIPILGWYSIPPHETTVARYTEMKDAGFSLSFTFFGSADHVQMALDTAEAVGMKIVIRCPELRSDPENTVLRFMDHPALAGYYLDDEPSMSEFAGLGEWAKRIQAVDSVHFCYVNLYPNSTPSFRLGTSDYKLYVKNFYETVPQQIYSYDHYPFTGDSLGKFSELYYDNLEFFSDEAKKAGKPFWAFAMATAIYGTFPIPTTAALRLQMFSSLAYGAQGLQYFTYWTPPCGDDECFHDGPIYNGERTPVYYKVQQVSKEIQGLSGVFLGSGVVSVRHTGSIPQGTTRLTELPEQIKVLEISGQGAVVSVLERDSLAFLAVVNRDFRNSMDLTIKGDSSVRRVLKDGTLVPAEIKHIRTIAVEPGDIAVFAWPKGDSIRFKPLKGQLIHLTLDYDLKDVSGNGINGIDVGTEAAAFVDDPNRYRVANFTENSYVAFPDTSALHFGTEDFSFAVWVKFPAVGGTPVILSNKDFSSATGAGFSLYLDHADTPGSKQWGVSFADGSGNTLKWEASDHGGASIADDQWHFIAVSFERNGMMTVNLDGELMDGAMDMSVCPGSAYEAGHAYPLTLLQDRTGANPDKVSGNVDDFRLWGRALTEEEMSTVYVSDTTGKDRELVYLPLDSDLKDASGNGYDATDAGTVATTFVSDPDRGQVAYFDRLSHAALPKVDDLRLGTRDFSFSLWIKCSAAPYTPVIVSNKDLGALGATRKKGFAFFTNESNKSSGDRWSVNFANGETEEGGSGEAIRWNAKDNNIPTIADDKWHFVAISFDRDKTMDIYLDGELQPGSLDIGVMANGMAHDDVNDYPIMLMQDGSGKFWMDIPASMDEFRFWGRPLKPSEVRSLYNNELVTSTEEVLQKGESALEMRVYPNPASSVVTVTFNSKRFGDAKVMIYNTLGTLVNEIPVTAEQGINRTTFDVNEWVTGIYLVRIVNGEKSETIQMVVSK
ncbi:T9SS C-terminal target domain-containing protein [Mariniphaga sediminis]|uniref:T9SS C-terminal target domain-containing protein n=1 Tax=Mariniphaga sediminis TaxID=1628158 RepID=A0A399D954_9BACT|nr:LamG-like jellyroll fold domain-containing protein [Mariniphaga sediminis]RIH66902.1 T9SS C-terminal target domain-containing protein [Mariniphaga sediminis]